jgi:hypothetical protein
VAVIEDVHWADEATIDRHPGPELQHLREKAPSGAKFTFWHPDLITIHVWVWYPNPAGLFSGTNPLVAPFSKG